MYHNFRVKKVKYTGGYKIVEDRIIPDFKVYLKGGFRSYKEDLEEARQEIAKEHNFNIEDVKTDEEWIQYGKDKLEERAKKLKEQEESKKEETSSDVKNEDSSEEVEVVEVDK